MPRPIKMTRITVTRYDWEVLDLGREERLGFDEVYRPGNRQKAPGSILTIETDAGVKGEAPGDADARTAQYLLGRNPLERDKIWHDLKRSQRGARTARRGTSTSRCGTSPAGCTRRRSTSCWGGGG